MVSGDANQLILFLPGIRLVFINKAFLDASLVDNKATQWKECLLLSSLQSFPEYSSSITSMETVRDRMHRQRNELSGKNIKKRVGVCVHN